jgi:restriction system protein
MSIPTYDKFIEPILRYLAINPNGLPAPQVYEAAANTLNLSDDDKKELLPSGIQAVYKNRAGWAYDRLKRAGLSRSPRRGFWKITEQGIQYAENHADHLNQDAINNLAMGYIDVRLRPAPDAEPIANVMLTTSENASVSTLVSPDERLGEAVIELRHSTAAELLEALANVSPTYFETIVLDLLHKMGYGTNRSDLQRVGGPSDGGVDGVISLDKLGLEKVYIQAKRWQNTVGRPEIQGFYGALAGQRANKGVFITTSGFTSQAIEFAKSVERVILVDGVRMAELMIDYDVGVSSKIIKVPKIDSDYFDEES